MKTDPLILTADCDLLSQQRFQALRNLHFPRHLNLIPAHITLFHQLPGDAFASINETVQAICDRCGVLPFEAPGLRFLGRGTAIEIDAPLLCQLRGELAEIWQEHLTPQDRHRFKPHVTIQNKVEAKEAKTLYDCLKSNPICEPGSVIGLTLWHYRNGPWELAKKFTI